jgi:hypothetical protein
LAGKRIVRGRENDCLEHHRQADLKDTLDAAPAATVALARATGTGG